LAQLLGIVVPTLPSRISGSAGRLRNLAPAGFGNVGHCRRRRPTRRQDYADRVGGTFPILADPAYLTALIPEEEPEALAAAQQMATSYTINNYPTHIFINRDGTVGAVVISPMSYDDAIRFGEEALASPHPENLPVATLPGATPAIPVRSGDD
jgi:hypothetical protein